MAGAPGFEPGNGGTKNRCLTAWLRPNRSNLDPTPDHIARASRQSNAKLALSIRDVGERLFFEKWQCAPWMTHLEHSPSKKGIGGTMGFISRSQGAHHVCTMASGTI